jgi:uncharacterized protein YciI
MPLFVLYGQDVADGVEIRKATRPAHLDWMAALDPRVKMAGPMFADDGATPVGSVMVLEAESLADARAVFATDPYATNGLWKSCDIRPFNWVIRQGA